MVSADEQLGPNARAWRDFMRYQGDEWCASLDIGRAKEAFDAGVRHGIEFVMKQIGWTLQDRADGHND